MRTGTALPSARSRRHQDIEHHSVGRARRHRRERLRAVGRESDGIARLLERAPQGGAHRGLVIDNQDPHRVFRLGAGPATGRTRPSSRRSRRTV
jgi:hypothetical protein